MRELGILITLNADAHKPEMLTASFEPVAERLAAIGFRELHVLREGKWEGVGFTPQGLAV